MSVMRDDILEVIEIWKLQKPSIYMAEIRNRLLLEGICALADLPSMDAINKSLQKTIVISMKLRLDDFSIQLKFGSLN